MNCKEANEILITDFLSLQGIDPKRITGNDYWYLSPIRNERTPSFKVNISINRWYDHGIGTGGKLVDLGVKLFNVDVAEFLERIKSQDFPDSFSFHQPKVQRITSVIKKVKKLENKALINYLIDRAICPTRSAEIFCNEIYFSVNDKSFFGIGFKNDLGGYEIRNKYFKGCIGQKGITTIINGSHGAAKTFALFEGFFDFISAYQEGGSFAEFSSIILNSVNQIHHAIAELHGQGAENIAAYFDNDEAGRNCFTCLKEAFPNAIDGSDHYKGFKDLNEMIIHNKLKYHG